MDFDQYTGIPWECGKRSHESADCWGLILLVLEEQFGVVVNHMKDIAVSDHDVVSNVMVDSRGLDGWHPTNDPSIGCICMFYESTNESPEGRPTHVGIVVADGYILHSPSRDGGSSSIHPIRALNRLFKRLEFFEYAAN